MLSCCRTSDRPLEKHHLLCGQVPVTAHKRKHCSNMESVQWVLCWATHAPQRVSSYILINREFCQPVVADDGRGQDAGEQPTKLSQRVKEGPVVRFHTGALDRNTRRLNSALSTDKYPTAGRSQVFLSHTDLDDRPLLYDDGVVGRRTRASLLVHE